ncbi:MAG: DUF305 domain-containing protein [Candidatus Eremiobacter antarcticus]|nr:DUF305 domain-containing protein [Candidatus Eremiobacteraeota bacterium]MBC5807231.1 DUF305 domain-containing protein [Candidatus Eremiobacteraeota bacterium]PZR61913.1 MAG: DUF305 domain-containing protein [Candidatus Eremiobacter sp. RRmetagenome_bin22]
MHTRSSSLAPLAAFVCGVLMGAGALAFLEPSAVRAAASAMPMGLHGSSQLHAAMDHMMDSSAKASLNGDTDHDFLTLMIAHHQGPIEMAGIELRQGRRPEVRRLAQRIIAAQTSEIKQMRAWLRAMPQR